MVNPPFSDTAKSHGSKDAKETARQEPIRTSGVEFELAYSDDWVDVFDKRLEQARGPRGPRGLVLKPLLTLWRMVLETGQALCEIEDANIPQAGCTRDFLDRRQGGVLSPVRRCLQMLAGGTRSVLLDHHGCFWLVAQTEAHLTSCSQAAIAERTRMSAKAPCWCASILGS